MFLKSSLFRTKTILLLLVWVCMPFVSLAEGAALPAAETGGIGKYQLMRYVLLGIIILLLLVIMVMGNAVAAAGKIYWEREKKKNSFKPVNRVLPLIVILLLSGSLSHAHAPGGLPESAAGGVPYDIYLFVVIAALEFVIVMVLANILLKFLKVESVPENARMPFFKRISTKQLFQKLNQTVALEEEHTIDLQHNYDGIRELDNKVPGWWRYAFYASILFGVVYLYRMFIAETLPTQFQELEQANYIAAVQKEEYLKNAANNVDENTVTLVDASGIADGAMLFNKNCVACHGDKGQGGVGPNLTDEYWLHEGGLKDVFHSIKYGWPEKGMKSWKDDFSPAQIAQLASYVKSLSGTKPPGAKEPQGTIYTDTKSVADNGPVKSKL
jgi:cytochrome c oxidase cbb3-type subunit III